MNMPIKNRNLATVLWLFTCLFLLVLSLGLSWQVNKSANFFYEFWYTKLNIEQTVKTYVPQNTQGKRDFASTDTLQHIKSFNEIVYEINNNGSGLSKLSYQNKDKQHKLLLTTAEVVHLQDVSDLVNRLHSASVINLLLLLIVIVVVYRFKQPKPLKKQQYMALTIPSVTLFIVFSIFGFTDIFYYLHTLVFPDNHQWFFYYQESLMSSLMKAPDLFAGIGLSLVVVAFVFYVIIYRLLMTKIFKG
ncbi:MAG: DUF1461 domain-containing protein [Colwellia sp.]|nr:DUF1461 domain-containing protein [Colwellia sp.]